MAWKKLPANIERALEMDDDELVYVAPMVMYAVPSGLVAVSMTNPRMSEEDLLEALHDIIEGVQQHGIPNQPMMLHKKFDA